MRKRELRDRIAALEERIAPMQVELDEALVQIELLKARLTSAEGRIPFWYPWWGYYPVVTCTGTSGGTYAPPEPVTCPGGLTSDPLPPAQKIWSDATGEQGTAHYPNEGAFPAFEAAVSRVMSEHADLWRALSDT